MQREFETPISAIEEALGMPLEERWLERMELGWPEVESLYFALKKYHLSNGIATDRNVVRTNVDFATFSHPLIVLNAFDGYLPNTLVPRGVAAEWDSGEVLSNKQIKTSLLFCDEVVIEDHILAMCRAALCDRLVQTPVAEQWRQRHAGYMIAPFPLIKAHLLRLASLRSLLENRLVRIAAFFTPPTHTDTYTVAPILFAGLWPLSIICPDLDARRLAASILEVNLDSMTVAHNLSILVTVYRQIESLRFARVDGLRLCPFLPDAEQLDLFKHLIMRAPAEIAGKEAFDAFDLGEINSSWGIDAQQIQLRDLISIRKNSAVFEAWRSTVRQSLSYAREHAEQGFSQPDAFKAGLAESERNWRATLSGHRKGFLGSILSETNPMCVAVVGAALGAALTGANPAGAAIGALGGSGIGILLRCFEQFERFNAERSALAFFMAARDKA